MWINGAVPDYGPDPEKHPFSGHHLSRCTVFNTWLLLNPIEVKHEIEVEDMNKYTHKLVPTGSFLQGAE